MPARKMNLKILLFMGKTLLVLSTIFISHPNHRVLPSKIEIALSRITICTAITSKNISIATCPPSSILFTQNFITDPGYRIHIDNAISSWHYILPSPFLYFHSLFEVLIVQGGGQVLLADHAFCVLMGRE